MILPWLPLDPAGLSGLPGLPGHGGPDRRAAWRSPWTSACGFPGAATLEMRYKWHVYAYEIGTSISGIIDRDIESYIYSVCVCMYVYIYIERETYISAYLCTIMCIYICVYLYDRGQTDKNTGQNGDELQYQLKMNLPGFGTAQMMNHTQMMTGIFVRASV